ncbi:MAG TPA: serine/threonine-protein kinase, partial [Nannocystaceae bacterium]|nr:serine/threonine-protein kinase [Nannocystaceae bacterium]
MTTASEPTATGEGSTLAGRYRLESFVGQGGMSFVYAATDEHANERVAIKVLRPKYLDHAEMVERFLREARAAARVPHPNIVEIRDYGIASDGQVFTAMEFLLGESLASTLAREGALPWNRVRHLGLQLCAAAGAAHRAGVVHRDISLGNAFRIQRGADRDFVKLVDFGL